MIDLSLIHHSAFNEITALLFLAAFIGFCGQLLRQPMIVSFIAAGIIAGPSALGIVQAHDQVKLLAELGVAVLLFLVGLKLDLHLVRTLGLVSLATGLGQVIFTSIVGFLIAIVLGLSPITAIYVAVALTFSSTIIIVKLLSDKREVDSLHGRIAIGFLIVQDLVVVLAMMALSALGIASEAGGPKNSAQLMVSVLGYSAAIVAFVGLFIRYLALPLTSRLARSSELLITFAIAWAALLAALGDYFGFGKELGGLLAGVSLASTPYRETILSRLASLRDFLLLFFFIALGAMLDLSLLGAQATAAVVLSLFVLIGNPLIVMIIMKYLGFHQRTGFFAGLTVAQISEFSLIFMAMGMTLGHVNADALGLVTLVGLITIAASVYMISYSHTLYRLLEPTLVIFQPRSRSAGQSSRKSDVAPKQYDVILFGLGRYGTAIANNLLASGQSILSIDFNPEAVRNWQRQGHSALFGDASDQEFLSSLPLRDVRWVISAIPQYDFGVTREDPRVSLLEALKQSGFTGKVAVTTQKPGEVEELMQRGADLVLQPFNDAALQVSRLMSAASE